MSSTVDFTWSTTDEPHCSRRVEILKAHPEIKTLMVREPRTFWMVLGVVLMQLGIAYLLRDQSWWLITIVAYVVGGTANHSMQLASHELSHNLCFAPRKGINLNECLAILCNMCTGIPSAISFKRYHLDHHKYQGTHGVDTDVPTRMETKIFTNAPLKALWMFMQPLFYALRPTFTKPQTPIFMEIVNYIAVLTVDYLVYTHFSGKALAYLVMGSLLGLGLHPTAGHFIAEHYEFTQGYETYSYYGPLNYVNFNVGYHYEHHDFPNIPWSKLPMVRKMAPEFYDNLPHYDSYIWVIWNYITNPKIGPHSRVKRMPPNSTPEAIKEARSL